MEKKTDNFAQKFRDYLQRRSFVEMKKADPPSFQWASPINYDFNAKKVLDTKGMEKNDDLKKLNSLTIRAKFTMDDSIKGEDGLPLTAEIIGHSECNCWGITYDFQGINFGKKCEENQTFAMGQYAEKQKAQHIAIVYDANAKTLKFFNKKLGAPQAELITQEDNITFDFFCQGVVNIGQTVFSNSNKFVGRISFV